MEDRVVSGVSFGLGSGRGRFGGGIFEGLCLGSLVERLVGKVAVRGLISISRIGGFGVRLGLGKRFFGCRVLLVGR